MKPGAPCWGLEGLLLPEPQALHLLGGPGAWWGPAGGVGAGSGSRGRPARGWCLRGTGLRQPAKDLSYDHVSHDP